MQVQKTMYSIVLFGFTWITTASVTLAEFTVPPSSELKMKVPKLFGYAENAYRIPAGIAFEDFYQNLTRKYPQMVSITSPQYPFPYPVEQNTHYKLTVTNSTGMEIFVHKMDIDPLTDFIKLTPLNSDGSERRSVILTGKLKAPIKFRSIGFTTIDVTFGAWTDVNHSFTGFFLSYTPYGNISYPPARIPQTPAAEFGEIQTISKFLTIPNAQQTKATWYRLKQLLAKSANEYIHSNRSLILEMATPNNVTIVYLTKCSDNWPNSKDCIDLEFAIILYNDTEKMATDIDPFMQENSLRIPAGLSSQQLEEMWKMFALRNLELEGFQMYVLPDMQSEILMWSGLFLGAMVGILLFFVGICRWKLIQHHFIDDKTTDETEETKPQDKVLRDDEDITMFASPIQMTSEFYQAKESDNGNFNKRRFDVVDETNTNEGNVQFSNQNRSHGYETITEASCEDEDEPKM